MTKTSAFMSSSMAAMGILVAAGDLSAVIIVLRKEIGELVRTLQISASPVNPNT